MSRFLMAPDWVMVGFPLNEGTVGIIASTTLAEASLRSIVEDRRTFISGLVDPYTSSVDRRFELRGVLHRFVYITGPSYAEALRRLFDEWDPQATAALDAVVPALPPAAGR